jgi:neutral ceramidase
VKHKATRATILTIPLLAVLGAANSHAAGLAGIDAGPLRVGVASAVTTFEEPGTLAGFGGRKGVAAGVHKDVTATCVVFDNGAARLAFLALDILALRPAEHLDFLRAAATEAGIPPQHLMVNSSHTHYAPTIGRKGSYTTLFKERTGALFQAAVDDLEPAVLDYAVGSCTMGISKRQADAKGQIGMRPDPHRQIDPDVPVLRVLSSDGAVRVVLFGYACHPTTVGPPAWDLVNPDYPGFARDWIAAAYPGSTPVFLQGCAGDVKPRIVTPDPSGYGRFGYVLLSPLETVAEMGHELGRAALSAVMVPPEPVPAERPTELDEALAAPVHLAGIVEQVQLPLREVDPSEPPRLFDMGAWRIGDLYVFGLSGEVFSQIGMRVKRELAGRRVWTNGYTGAGAVYIPDAVSHREGGGVVRGTPVTAEAEDAIVANAIRQAKLLEEGKTGNGPVVRP